MNEHSKSQQAYALLKDRIASQEFPPGHRLVLSQLASELDMSVVPIREAIRRLEAEGMVEYERNVGARVASIDPVEYLNTMETLAILEAAATGLAAAEMTDERLDEARTINERIADLLDDFNADEFARLNHEFHRTLYVDCPNDYLCELVDTAWSKMSMVREPSQTFLPTRAERSVQEHERILLLIEAKASRLEIERAVREHRTATRDAALAHLNA